jgi:HK97 gp10 family phage protein
MARKPSRASRGKGVVRVEGRTALIANIYRAEYSIVEEMRVATRRAGQETRDLAVQLAPKETGYMARNIKVEYTPDEIGFDVFCDPNDYLPHGLPFYPPYQEYGTSMMEAQPFLRPAFEAMSPYYRADISRAIRRALAMDLG